MRPLLFGLFGLLLLCPSAGGGDRRFPDIKDLPARKELPDPLVLFDGTRVKTPKDWREKRRPELRALFQHYMYGTLPPPVKVSAKVEYEDRKALGGKAILREVSLTVGPPGAPKIHLLLVIPLERKGPVPAFVGMNFCGNHALVDDPAIRIPTAWMYPRYPGVKGNKATAAGRGTQKDVWALDQAIARGYAVATFYNGDIDPDDTKVRGGIRPFWSKPGEKPGPQDTATLMAWAWGIHRAVDYLLTVAEINSTQIAVVGHSRLGKTALLAAAFDDRIALAIPHQAGCGGTAPSRDWIKDWVNKHGDRVETVARINTSFPHWFNGEFKKFNESPERLPIDQNCLAALVAPRPLLFTNAAEDVWANPAGQFAALQSAGAVYRLLKAGGLATKEMPKEGELSTGTLGYYIRAGKHSMTREDWKVFLDYADVHLKKGPKGRAAAPPRRLLLIGQGPDGHPAGTHEYVAGLRELAKCLAGTPGLTVATAQADGPWREGPELLDRADGAVLFLSEGAKWIDSDPARKAALNRLAKRGGGVVVLHWAMGTRDARHIAACRDLFGGCHGGPDRRYKVVTVKAKVATPAHPISRGLADFNVKDEFYYRLKFVEPDGTVTPILRVPIEGSDETVAWAWERAAGGRAFGFSGLHFHANWKLPAYRRMVTQGVLWTLKLPIPEGGIVLRD